MAHETTDRAMTTPSDRATLKAWVADYAYDCGDDCGDPECPDCELPRRMRDLLANFASLEVESDALRAENERLRAEIAALTRAMSGEAFDIMACDRTSGPGL